MSSEFSSKLEICWAVPWEGDRQHRQGYLFKINILYSIEKFVFTRRRKQESKEFASTSHHFYDC